MGNGYNPSLRADNVGMELGFCSRSISTRSTGRALKEDKSAAAAEWTRMTFPGFGHGWEDVKFLKEHWDGTIVLKGIQTEEAPLKCIDVGVQRITVSNHRAGSKMEE
jgi:lactate 2-monooxygenase